MTGLPEGEGVCSERQLHSLSKSLGKQIDEWLYRYVDNDERNV